MADPSTHPDFDLDVALSAALDGELDAYAAELGLPVADLQAAIRTPAARARGAELASARAAVAEPARLDDVTRRRLLAGAGVGEGRPAAAPRPGRDRGWILRAGAAAAVTLVVLAGLFALTRPGDDGAKSSGSGAGSSARSAAAPTGDLGDIGTLDPAQIGRLLRGGAPTSNSTSLQEKARSSSAAGADAVPGFDANAPTADAGTASACAAQYAAQGTVRFRASGSYQGQPAVVLGIDTSGRTIVFVVAADDCTRVLYSASR
jgi:hypothetical protein